MRFSDMMGSGDEKSSKRSTPSESEALIADALAPYLGAGSSNVAAAAAEPVAEDTAAPEASEAPAVAEVADATDAPPAPIAPPVPVATPASVFGVVPSAPSAPVERPPAAPADAIASTIADFAPISDDLLPRRR